MRIEGLEQHERLGRAIVHLIIKHKDFYNAAVEDEVDELVKVLKFIEEAMPFEINGEKIKYFGKPPEKALVERHHFNAQQVARIADFEYLDLDQIDDPVVEEIVRALQA
jgi:hypothetical protein